MPQLENKNTHDKYKQLHVYIRGSELQDLEIVGDVYINDAHRVEEPVGERGDEESQNEEQFELEKPRQILSLLLRTHVHGPVAEYENRELEGD